MNVLKGIYTGRVRGMQVLRWQDLGKKGAHELCLPLGLKVLLLACLSVELGLRLLLGAHLDPFLDVAVPAVAAID